jgi:hypothetical protein
LVVLLSGWRRNRKLLLDARSATQVRAGERTNENKNLHICQFLLARHGAFWRE